MRTKIAWRMANDVFPAFERTREVFDPRAVGAVGAALVMAAMIASSFVVTAAADEEAEVKAAIQPLSLAGRWSGSHFGFGRRGDSQTCAENGCKLTYDIVACKEGWCGIAINDDKSCGSVGMRLAFDAKRVGGGAFKGRIELAKGAAPYTVAAWYHADQDSGTRQLHFLGDTGPELLLMRRSFPFEANLERVGEATCTLDKATS